MAVAWGYFRQPVLATISDLNQVVSFDDEADLL
jgi:hypothetical protein